MNRIDVRTVRMSPHRVLVLAAVLAVAGNSGALAQAWPQGQQSSAWPQSNSQGQQSNAWPQSGAGPQSNPWQQQQQQQANPCAAFLPIKEDAEKTVVALNAAQKRNAPREEYCQLFTRLANATGRMLKFLEQNKTQCNVPNQAVQDIRAEHNKSLAVRKNACGKGPGNASANATPSLSDVLGSPVLPDSSTTKPDMGTFNTLTGNPLIR